MKKILIKVLLWNYNRKLEKFDFDSWLMSDEE